MRYMWELEKARLRSLADGEQMKINYYCILATYKHHTITLQMMFVSQWVVKEKNKQT